MESFRDGAAVWLVMLLFTTAAVAVVFVYVWSTALWDRHQEDKRIESWLTKREKDRRQREKNPE